MVVMDLKRERLCWIGVVLVAVMCGIGVGRVGNGSDGAAENARAGRATPRDHGGSKGAPREDSHWAGIRDETELRKMANHALSTPRRTERFQRLMAMLDNTTAENWNTLWKEYIRQTLEEGRVHETEWSLFMNRVGEVGGPDAMEYFSHHGQQQYTFNRREVLKGWAAMEPRGALEWLKAQPVETQAVEFWGAVMAGAAASDSKLALELLSEIPAKLTQQVVRSTVDGLIQTEGLAHTARLLEERVSEIPEGEAIPPDLQFFYQELDQRVGRMKWLADSYPDMNSRQPSLDLLAQRFGGAPPDEPDGTIR
jgi:hypothetical protein